MADQREHEAEGTEEELEMASAAEVEPVHPDRLRWTCDPGSFGFDSTADIEPLVDVIGQETALEALRFGLSISAPGQNVFVRGLRGTGRMTLVRRLLERIQLQCPNTQDRCYVHHFADPSRPRLISLPRGSGASFRKRVDELADFVAEDLPGALASDAIQARRQAIDEATQFKIDKTVKPFEDALKEAGLALGSVKVGPAFQAVIFPVVEGNPVPPEQWQAARAEGKVSEDQVKAFEKQHALFQTPLRDVMSAVSDIRRKRSAQVHGLEEEAANAVLSPMAAGIHRDYPFEAVEAFLAELVEDAATVWVRRKTDEQRGGDLRHYRVGVVLAHDRSDACSIVVEHTPTARNLLGAIDHRPESSWPGQSDHHMIRAGSILRADGGYLILAARDIIREPEAWKVLLRTLRTGLLEIAPSELGGAWWSSSLKPEPIDVNLKVVLIGDVGMYLLLDEHDADFRQLFKVLADFESEIPRNKASVEQYAGVLARIAQEEQLPPFDRTAIAALAEHGSRIAGRQHKLTTRFGRLADLAREAAFLAREETRTTVTGDDVRSAIRRTRRRAELPSRRFQESLANGTIRVATSGMAVGQVNGLAVAQAGPLTFGFPARITATIGPGSAGVINIERESNLSGSVHTKGFYILGGLLRHLLRTEHPLAFHASVAFEQSYGGIDGDSASCAEICCLLSALTEIPLRQDLAITGAIDQMGNILAIGAANEKIEGFFDTCRHRGFTGTQGVIIPQANTLDLMLRPDVVHACREGNFWIYAVGHVREALELLTGIKAGERGEQGLYPQETLLGLAVIRAFEYWVKAVQGLESLGVVQEEDESDEPDQEADPSSPPVI